MNVVCPRCKSVYKAPDTLPHSARFNCKKCGLSATLGQLLQAAAQEQAQQAAMELAQDPLYNSQIEESDLAVVELDALPAIGGGGAAPPAAPAAGGLGLADEPGGGGLDLADPQPAPAAQRRAKAPARGGGGGGGGLDLMDDEEEEPESHVAPEDDWDELQPAPQPTLADKLQENLRQIVTAVVAVIVILVVVFKFKNREDPAQLARRARAQHQQQQQAAATPTPTPSATPSAQPSPSQKPEPKGPTLQELMDKVDELRKQEKFTEALQVMHDLDYEQNRRVRDFKKVVAELKRLEAFRKLARSALDHAEELRGKDPLLARHYVERALRSVDHEVPDIPTGRALLKLQAELIEEVPILTGGIPPETPREEPDERKQALAKARQEAEAKVAALRKQIDEEKSRRERQHQDEVARARELTSTDPLSMDLAPGMRVSDAQLVDFDDYRFKIRSGGDEYAFEWDTANPTQALDIRRRSVRDDDAQDQVRFGYWCLRRRMFNRAGEAFRKALDLDSSLGGHLPDVGALRQASRIFHGDLELRGSNLDVGYDFDAEDQAKDWEPEERGTKLGVSDGALVIQGAGVFLAQLREVGFKNEAELTAIPSTAGKGRNLAVVLGLGFDMGTDDEVIYLVAAYIEAKVMALYRLQGGRLEELEVKQKAVRGTRPRLRLKARRDQIIVTAGGKSIKKRISADWENCRVLVGGAGKGRGNVAIGEIKIGGNVRYSWVRKSFGEFEALLQGFLAREEQLDVFDPGSEGQPEPPLTAEDEWSLEPIKSDLVTGYQEVVAEVGEQGAEPKVLIDAIEQLSEIIAQSPEFAAAYYRRGVCLTKLGSPRLALPDLEQACACEPEFHEALAWKAIVLGRLGDYEGAMKAANRAVEIYPDALGLLARGGLYFDQTKLPEALADLELARALQPDDAEIASVAQAVGHVVEGPPWARRFDHETKSYTVGTNIPDGIDELAQELEAVRKHYMEAFHVKELPDVGKASVLIFDTEEGYHSYAELTTEDRGAYTLGLYVPRYRQLLMYQEADDPNGEETRQTLFHEGFHQFMHQLVGDNPVPFWLNEGLAEYESAVRLKQGVVVDSGLVLEGRLSNLRMFLKRNRGRPMSFKELMQESPAEFYSGLVWAKYAQAWAMVHFFYQGTGQAVQQKFQRYLGMIMEGISGHDAFQEVWAKDTNWRRLEGDFVDYVKSLGN